MSPALPRRVLLGGLGAGLLLGRGAAAQAALERQEWQIFHRRFVSDGRVVDTGNRGVSHSEGQGWGMYAAARLDDRAAFDRLWGWTRAHLRRPQDALHAWRWRPGAAMPVDDLNNAVDGDLFIAAALVMAGERWGEEALAAQGQAVARDILRLCTRRLGDRLVLLPGAQGFERRDELVVNPSYYAFPALRCLAAALPDPGWLALAAGGLGLLRRARFGRWQLPPDWIALGRGGTPSLPGSWQPRFSYDAVRVPLYLAWAGMAEEPAVAQAIAFWTDPRHHQFPAWTDLTTNAVSPYPAPSGMQAVAAAAMAARGGVTTPGDIPLVAHAPDYYSGMLTLLARFARHDCGSLPV
jgi:endo-1,4-beta-D-glucanase Y